MLEAGQQDLGPRACIGTLLAPWHSPIQHNFLMKDPPGSESPKNAIDRQSRAPCKIKIQCVRILPVYRTGYVQIFFLISSKYFWTYESSVYVYTGEYYMFRVFIMQHESTGDLNILFEPGWSPQQSGVVALIVFDA